jgi:hypothetical protein
VRAAEVHEKVRRAVHLAFGRIVASEIEGTEYISDSSIK